MYRKMRFYGLAAGLLLGSFNAQATLINLQITADVSVASGYGGLPSSCTDCITADLVYDTASITYNGNMATIDFSSGNSSGNTIDITAGSLSFDETMDLAGDAFLKFTDGLLVDFNYSAQLGSNSAPETFDSFNLFISASDAGTLVGQWNPVQLVVPIPAAAWLFGSGLLGLVGVARRRKAIV